MISHEYKIADNPRTRLKVWVHCAKEEHEVSKDKLEMALAIEDLFKENDRIRNETSAIDIAMNALEWIQKLSLSETIEKYAAEALKKMNLLGFE